MIDVNIPIDIKWLIGISISSFGVGILLAERIGAVNG